MKAVANKIQTFFTTPIILVLGAGLLFRLALASFGTLALDQNTFIAWGHILARDGFYNFYHNWSDYLPGYLYVLALLAKLESVFPVSTTILYKLPAILGDIGVGLLIFSVAKRKNFKKPFLVVGIFLFNPAVLYNSTIWGQVDVLTALFSILSIYLFESQFWLSAIFLAVGSLIKPQAALAAPVVVYLMYKNKTSILKSLGYVVFSAAIFVAGFLPFYTGGSALSFVVERLSATISQYQYGSVNAFNFWGLWGFWQREGSGVFSINHIGLAIFAVVAAASYFRFRKFRSPEFLFLGILFLANFLFFTRMHERHLLPAIVALSAATPLFPAAVAPAVLLSVVYVLNMYYAQIWIIENFREVFPFPLISGLILVNILSLVLVFLYPQLKSFLEKVKEYATSRKSFKETKDWFISFWKSKKDMPLPQSLTKRQVKIILFGIITFAFISRIISLESPPKEYFDEVYHAFTARAMFHGDKKAWEWWNENPQGFAYEWTHPPLAKEAMVMGMRLTGEGSFGWRLPAAVFGTIAVFLVFLVASTLFNDEVGLLSAGVFALDGLTLTMSRIGMNDIYLMTFILLTLFLFLKNKYFLSSIALGLAAASKWTTLWFAPVLIFLFVFLRKKVRRSIVWFFILPPIIYVASYLPQFLSGHDFSIFWGMQKQMWWYHTRLVATHPYTSQWWGWPFILRPIWLYTSGEQNGFVANIYGMGNPAVFWGGIVGAVAALYYGLLEKRKKVLAVLALYCGLFMPWAISPRIMFFYHYFPAVPFMCVALGFVLYKHKKFILPFFAIAIVLFIYFYPHWTGIPVPVWLDKSYYWLPSWR